MQLREPLPQVLAVAAKGFGLACERWWELRGLHYGEVEKLELRELGVTRTYGNRYVRMPTDGSGRVPGSLTVPLERSRRANASTARYVPRYEVVAVFQQFSRKSHPLNKGGLWFL
jgi:hypothetical protein